MQKQKYKTPETFLEKLVWDGMRKRYKELNRKIIGRTKQELLAIKTPGYARLFLFVHDIVRFAKRRGIRTSPGRGAIAGSIVAYALGITNIDPLRHGLIFERFINIERESLPPWIFVDFDFERLDEILQYVAKKYGKKYLALIGTSMSRNAAIYFLGAWVLSVISRALKLIKKKYGTEIDLNRICLDDSRTYSLLGNGETIGVFDLENFGMRNLIKDSGIHDFNEIIALLALWRPGPLGAGMVGDYICQTPVKYLHPRLKPILDETHGIIIYQEQIMLIANKIAGFSMGQADVLRWAMIKRQTEETKRKKACFVKGAVNRGVQKRIALKIFDFCAKYAGRSFLKAHAAAFALISYQTAYIKAHYPEEFMAALLYSVKGNKKKTASYLKECKRMGIAINI